MASLKVMDIYNTDVDPKNNLNCFVDKFAAQFLIFGF